MVTQQPVGTKDERFNIRATADEKRLVEQAAVMSHVTASQFVMQAALRSAEEIVASQTRFTLSPEAMARFVDRLDRPAVEIAALMKAATKPSPFSER